MGEIETLESEIRKNRVNDLPAHVEWWVTSRLSDLRGDAQKFKHERGFEHFVLDYLQREKRKKREGDREKPLCSCPNICDIKEGRVPPALTAASTIDDGVIDLKASHAGEPTVVVDAYTEYNEAYGRVVTAFETVNTAILRGELPPGITDDDLPEGVSHSGVGPDAPAPEEATAPASV
jgi:hypothetical protein